MFQEAIKNYRIGFAEIKFLLEIAKAAPVEVDPNILLSKQQVLVRAAVVLMTSHLEAFLKLIPVLYSDAITSSWTDLNRGQRRFLAIQVAHNLKILVDIEENMKGYGDKDIENVRSTVTNCSNVFQNPSTHTSLPMKAKLSNFYKYNSTESIENFLFNFRVDGIPFFGWLHRVGLDGQRFKTVVEGLVNERNNIAHGSGQCSLTLKDVRDYLAVTTRMVRLVARYLSET